MEEGVLRSTLISICEKYQIKVLIDPPTFTINSPAAIDVEHDEEGNLVGIGVYDGSSSLYFTTVSRMLSDKLINISLIAHNGISDFDLLRQWGIAVLNSHLVHDTMLIGHILDSSLRTYGLKDMAKRELGIEYPSYSDICGKEKAKVRRTLDKWPKDIVAFYNSLDTYCTYKLYEKQRKALTVIGHTTKHYQEENYFNTLEKPASHVFASMETRGIRVDLPYLRDLKDKLEAQKQPIEAEIKKELGDINLNSPKQLLGALHAKGIKPQLKGKGSTDKRALEAHKHHAIVSSLLSFSEVETLLTSFVNPYLERGQEVVNPRFSQTGTRTGRPSCSNPNLLQIPKRSDNGKLVRRMFIPRQGMSLGDADYGQIEPRVLAHASKDPDLCGLFNRGENFHEYTRIRMGFPDTDEGYNKAKVLNLSVGYRATFKSVSQQLKCTDKEAQNEINKWWSLFPGLRRWQDGLIYESKRSGYCTTLLGRRIRVDGLNDNNQWRREASERQLINNITQGSAAEIMKLAMIKIHGDLGRGAFQATTKFGLLVQVYDELVFEADSWDIQTVADEVKKHMENAIQLDVPLVVDYKIGPNWADVQ